MHIENRIYLLIYLSFVYYFQLYTLYPILKNLRKIYVHPLANKKETIKNLSVGITQETYTFVKGLFLSFSATATCCPCRDSDGM